MRVEARNPGGRSGAAKFQVQLADRLEPSQPLIPFTTDELLVSARVYRSAPLQVVLLWGVETWLADPAWMEAATQAMGILRTPSAIPAPSR